MGSMQASKMARGISLEQYHLYTEEAKSSRARRLQALNLSNWLISQTVRRLQVATHSQSTSIRAYITLRICNQGSYWDKQIRREQLNLRRTSCSEKTYKERNRCRKFIQRFNGPKQAILKYRLGRNKAKQIQRGHPKIALRKVRAGSVHSWLKKRKSSIT